MIPLFRGGDTTTALAKRGAFYAVGPRNDWVVACSRADSTRRSTTILAFAQSNGFKSDSVDFVGRDSFEQSEPSEGEPPKPRYFDSEVDVAAMPTGTLGEKLTLKPSMEDDFTPWERQQPLHDAIGFTAGATMFYYWTGKRWVSLPGVD